MSNKDLMIVKENIFTKIVTFFKKLFKKSHTEAEVNTVDMAETEIIKAEESQKYETDKKQFLQLYEQAKNGEVDLFSLELEQLKKMCILIEEEIKIEDSIIEKKREILKKYA